MIAQIRTGLWVRNGFAIRGQVLHCRDYMLRELCYDQDLYLLQTALIVLPPDLVIVSILDRFGLLAYFSGDLLGTTYEGAQLGSMVEEVFYVLTKILSENGNAGGMSVPKAIRREIVHALAMGCLEEAATFRPPEGPTETGLYELREQAYGGWARFSTIIPGTEGKRWTLC